MHGHSAHKEQKFTDAHFSQVDELGCDFEGQNVDHHNPLPGHLQHLGFSLRRCNHEGCAK